MSEAGRLVVCYGSILASDHITSSVLVVSIDTFPSLSEDCTTQLSLLCINPPSNSFKVLSRRTYKALQNLKNDEYDSTVELLRYINNVFDILNMRSRNEGARSRNKYKSPLTSSDDWRFEVNTEQNKQATHQLSCLCC